jgi:hypothetical protein
VAAQTILHYFVYFLGEAFFDVAVVGVALIAPLLYIKRLWASEDGWPPFCAKKRISLFGNDSTAKPRAKG